MKKRILAMFLALVMLLSMPFAVHVSAAETPFPDVPEDAFYYHPVNWAVGKSITKGMGDGLFHPGEACNRAQVVTFLWRLAGKPTATTVSSFTDVPKDAFYYQAVNWAVEQDITRGTGGNLFEPNTACNRAQIVTFLWRYADKPTSNAANPFTDVPQNAFYYEAVKWAVEKGITNGLSDTTFGPDTICNRAQVVTFLYRYDDVTSEKPPEEDMTPIA